jgi:hypothetical protein
MVIYFLTIKTKTMEADKGLLKLMETAVNSIFDETEDDVLDEKSSYEVPVQTVDVDGHRCQVVVKLIVDPSNHLNVGEIYTTDRVDSDEEAVLDDLDEEDED